MVWPLVVAAVASSAMGAFAGKSANDAAREAAEKQAESTYMQRMEEIRRAKKEQAQQVGYNKAAVGASNITMSGSAERALGDMQTEFAKDINFRNLAAIKEKSAIEAGGPGGAADLAVYARAGASIANTLIAAKG
jgi:hypothetical protein